MLNRTTLVGIFFCFVTVAMLWGQIVRSTSGAVANLEATQGSSVKGTVTFEEVDEKVRVTATLSGLRAGKHGFHIHDKGDCSARDASSAGGHYNPDNLKHGSPEFSERHTGDLGNLEADVYGQASLTRTYDLLSLEGAKAIVGKAVIVHVEVDDFRTQPTGDAGARVACGVIERVP